MLTIRTHFLWMITVALAAISARATEPAAKAVATLASGRPNPAILGPGAADRTLADYFRAETARLRDNCLAEVRTADDWNAKRDVYRRQLLDMFGLNPLPERTDLKAVIAGRVERNDFVVEKVHFQSLPSLYVTANLYLPKRIEKPCPAILYLCGHGLVKRNGISYGNKVHYQHHGIWFARHGYACLVVDSLQLGEIEAIHHGTYRYDRWWWNARGYSPAGVEAWNCMRAIDYLQSRKEIDGERIGATGRSGGGAYSWFIAAADDRIKVAVPVAGITDLENHIVDGTVEGHCDCMFFVNTYRWDYPQLAALVAPRPLLISNTDKDNIFPLEGVARTHNHVRRIYQLLGAEKNLGLQITEGPHDDTQELYTHAFVWFDRFLMGGRRAIDGPALPLFEPEELKVFDKLPADEVNTKIDETFVRQAAVPEVPMNQEAWAKLRDKWMADLGERTFRGWPTEPPPLDVKEVASTSVEGTKLVTYEYTGQTHVRLRFQVAAFLKARGLPRITLLVTDEATWKERDEALRQIVEPDKLLKLLRDDRKSVASALADGIFLAPRGVGPAAWNSDPKKQIQIRRRFMLLGQTLDGMRVWDVRRAVQAVRSLPAFRDAKITLEGQGAMATVALYASLYEPNLAGLTLVDLPSSHRDGPDLLNVLRSHDLPAAVAMALERTPVKLVEPKDEKAWSFPQRTSEALGWKAVNDAEGGGKSWLTIIGRAAVKSGG